MSFFLIVPILTPCGRYNCLLNLSRYMINLECIRLLDGELFVDKHISVKPYTFSNQRMRYDFEVDSRQLLAVAVWTRLNHDDGGVNGPQNQIEAVRVANIRHISPLRQQLRYRSPSYSRSSRSISGGSSSSSCSAPSIDRTRLNFNTSLRPSCLLNW